MLKKTVDLLIMTSGIVDYHYLYTEYTKAIIEREK